MGPPGTRQEGIDYFVLRSSLWIRSYLLIDSCLLAYVYHPAIWSLTAGYGVPCNDWSTGVSEFLID